jgi:hypothetical protein
VSVAIWLKATLWLWVAPAWWRVGLGHRSGNSVQP